MDENTIKIEKLAHLGYGLGYLKGKTLFVPFTLPGDEVQVKIIHQNKNVAFARVCSYLARSSAYLAPQCASFGYPSQCGACDFLHLRYEDQLKFKLEHIRQIFSPIVGSEPIKQIVASPQTTRYRNKVFAPVVGSGEELRYGMYKRMSHEVVSHEDCLLQPEIVDEVFRVVIACCKKAKIDAFNSATRKGILRHLGLRINPDSGELLLILVTKAARLPFSNLLVKEITSAFPSLSGIVHNIQRDNGNVILGNEDKLLFGKNFLDTQLEDLKFRLHYRSFWQVNTRLSLLLYNRIRENIDRDSVLIDAYCGIGSIGIYLADKLRHLIGIDEIPEAVENARENAALNKLSSFEFHCDRVERFLVSSKLENDNCTVILDPPRGGVDAEAINSLTARKIHKVIYISCNPMTLARDVKLFLQKGYSLMEIAPFDMFPQTWHIETLAVLQYTGNKTV